jgi:hypothetical protein
MTDESLDIKIISLHWGHEYEYYPDALQIAVARKIVSLGADIIMGSHPHVQQPYDVCSVNGYKFNSIPIEEGAKSLCLVQDKMNARPRKALIIYSLGNFITTMVSFYSQIGLIQGLNFVKTLDGHLDWNLEAPEFIMNKRKSFSAKFFNKTFHKETFILNLDRSSMTMNEYLKQCESGVYYCPPDDYQRFLWVKDHLF